MRKTWEEMPLGSAWYRDNWEVRNWLEKIR